MSEITHVRAIDTAPSHTAMYDYIASTGKAQHYSPIFRDDMGRVLTVPKDRRAAAAQLWSAYMSIIPEEHRSHFKCAACRSWFERFAAIQLVSWENDDITVESMFFQPEREGWENLSETEKAIVTALGNLVRKYSPGSVVIHRKGQAVDRAPGKMDYEHFYYPVDIDQRLGIKTADEYAAVRSKLLRFLNAELTVENLAEAKRLFVLDVKFAGYNNYSIKIDHLLRAKNRLQETDTIKRDAWRAVLALLPMRYYRSELIGSFLLEWETSGAESAKQLFTKMVDPREYRKPDALPHSIAVTKAEELIQTMGVANSLQFGLTSVDNPIIRWVTRYDNKVAPTTTGLFAALQTKDQSPTGGSTQCYDLGAMSLAKALDKYLGQAKSVHVVLSRTTELPAAVVSVATNPDSPAVLQHDTEEDRYPLAVMALQPAPRIQQLGFLGSVRERVCIEGIIEVPNLEANALPMKLLVFALPQQPSFALPNLLPHTLKPELLAHWRVIHHYNRTISQTPKAGDAFGFLLPQTPGIEYSSLGIDHLEITMADGTLAKLRLTTPD